MSRPGVIGPRVDWAVFDGFRRPIEESSLSWAAVDAWKAAIEVQFAPRRKVVRDLRARWDHDLREFGGDPHARDWSRFRALRRHREEDWSDWLAQLLEDSGTGWFAWRLLGALERRPSPADYVNPDVQREVTRDGFRADLVVLWRDATFSHIEVKVGDESLEKTHETSLKMEEHFRGVARRSSDILLVLPEQRPAWDGACRRNAILATRVRLLTWVDVARGLRDALRVAVGESPLWRSWAYAFCGAIEQELLGVRHHPGAEEWVRRLSPSALDLATVLLKPEEE